MKSLVHLSLVLVGLLPAAHLSAQSADPGPAQLGPARPGVSNPHGAGGVPTTLSPGAPDTASSEGTGVTSAAGSSGGSGASAPSASAPAGSASSPADPHTPTATAEQPKGDGVLEGRLVRKSSGDGVLEDLELRMFAFRSGQEKSTRVGEWRATTSADGTFRFTGISTDPGLKYIVSAMYQGVVYLSEGNQFAAGKSTITAEIPVYDSIAAPGPLKIDSMHIIVDAGQGAGQVQITEVVAFNNPGDRTLIGSPDSTTTWKLDLPAGAMNLQAHQGMVPNQVFLGEGALSYGGPIYPGVNQMVYSYELSPQSNRIFRRRFTFPAESVDVFVGQGGPAILSPQLSRSEPLRIQGSMFDRYTGGPFTAGAGVTFEIGGGATAAAERQKLPAVPIATVVGLALLAFLALPFFRRESTTPASPALDPRERRMAQLERERDQRMAEVQEIDFDFESGKLSEEDHKRLREAAKAHAIVVLQELETLRGGQTPGADLTVLEGGAPARPASSEAPVPHSAAPAGPLKFCTECGTPTVEGDKFCGHCGARLRVVNG